MLILWNYFKYRVDRLQRLLFYSCPSNSSCGLKFHSGLTHRNLFRVFEYCIINFIGFMLGFNESYVSWYCTAEHVLFLLTVRGL